VEPRPARDGEPGGGAPWLAFVIPARDEARTLPAVLESVRAHAGALVPETVVVDDGSRDDTAARARAAGARVVPGPATTAAAARNCGARAAGGAVLVFLDADVRLTAAWARAAPARLAALRAGARVVTGSRVDVPEAPSWIERHWFARLPARPGYVNSGHLILSRALFERLGGFREDLVTGEDVDLCRRARALGARIEGDAALHVVHDGFPRDLRAFFRRELWHGAGDASLGGIARSAPAAAGLALLALLAASLGAAALGSLRLAAAAAAGALLLAALATLRRFPALREPRAFAADVLLSAVYLVARGLAALRGSPAARPPRPPATAS
jgi:hypothetical protein